MKLDSIKNRIKLNLNELISYGILNDKYYSDFSDARNQYQLDKIKDHIRNIEYRILRCDYKPSLVVIDGLLMEIGVDIEQELSREDQETDKTTLSTELKTSMPNSLDREIDARADEILQGKRSVVVIRNNLRNQMDLLKTPIELHFSFKKSTREIFLIGIIVLLIQLFFFVFLPFTDESGLVFFALFSFGFALTGFFLIKIYKYVIESI